MADRFAADRYLVAMAVKLVQPGLLSDVVSGVQRLVPNTIDWEVTTERVRYQLQRLRQARLAELYEGRRYMLTARGEQLVSDTGIKLQIDARRMFLLKETRRANS
jgi:hypothetical protein